MFFNLEILTKHCNGNTSKMLEMLENYYYGRVPRNTKELSAFSKTSLSGTTWLPDPKAFFSSTVDIRYKRQYLILRSKQNIFILNEYGLDILDLSFYPDIDIKTISSNPLIQIDKNIINFKI